jgi:hypothetical protein
MLGLGRLWRWLTRRDQASDFLSCEIADPHAPPVIVTLDGMLVPFAVAADVDAGWVDVWRVDRMGRPINALGWPIRDRHYGRIRIMFRDDEARLEYADRPECCGCE